MKILKIIGGIILGIILGPVVVALGLVVAVVVVIIVILSKLFRIITFAEFRDRSARKKIKEQQKE
ncbi:MAG: hypothetical protein ACTSSG_00485 [Candidatus Heimdallarchaeaceae archaeon]